MMICNSWPEMADPAALGFQRTGNQRRKLGEEMLDLGLLPTEGKTC